MKNLDKEINSYFRDIEERFDACCDKEVAGLLKEIIFDELKQKSTFDLSDDIIKERIDKIIENKFG